MMLPLPQLKDLDSTNLATSFLLLLSLARDSLVLLIRGKGVSWRTYVTVRCSFVLGILQAWARLAADPSLSLSEVARLPSVSCSLHLSGPILLAVTALLHLGL